MRDKEYMMLALHQAQKAAAIGEIPVGAVVVYDDEVISCAHNEKELRNDATAHAEILAMQRAAEHLGVWRLTGATMYCTLEPCPMCAGAMINTRLSKLVYGARDPKAGSAGSAIDLLRYPGLNHQVEIQQGILEEECTQVLQTFFEDLRRDGRVGRRRSTRNRVGG